MYLEKVLRYGGLSCGWLSLDSQQSKEHIRSIEATAKDKRALSAPHKRGYFDTHVASSKLRTTLDP